MADRDAYDAGTKPNGRFAVLIAGGGVAGLEAAFALQHLAGDRVQVCVISDGGGQDTTALDQDR